MAKRRSKAEPGHLYVVATPIGNLNDLSDRARLILASCDLIVCEDTRMCGRLLAHLDIDPPVLLSYHEQNEKQRAPHIAEHITAGKAVALVSDAGTPTLSDPGFRLVRECRRRGLPVTPVPGASAALAALCASGLPTHGFLFVGFLPPKKSARQRFFEKYQDFEYTLVLYESCHRIRKCIEDGITVLGPDRIVCVARELTKHYETFYVGTSASVKEQLETACIKGEFVVLIAEKSFQL